MEEFGVHYRILLREMGIIFISPFFSQNLNLPSDALQYHVRDFEIMYTAAYWPRRETAKQMSVAHD